VNQGFTYDALVPERADGVGVLEWLTRGVPALDLARMERPIERVGHRRRAKR